MALTSFGGCHFFMIRHFLFLLIPIYCFAQTDQQRINDLDGVSSGGQQQMFGKNLPPPAIEGSSMYSENWYLGEILFKKGKIYKEYFIRYDIAKGIIETKKEGKSLSFKGEDIQKFSWFNDHDKTKVLFLNCDNYRISSTTLVGFFEIIIDDDISLLAHPVIDVKEPDYVEGLDVGNRNYKIKKTENFYFVLDDKLLAVKKSKNKNFKILERNYPELKSFVKEKQLSFKNRTDLIEIVKYMNQESKSVSSF